MKYYLNLETNICKKQIIQAKSGIFKKTQFINNLTKKKKQ
jgi:hypothetical protein